MFYVISYMQQSVDLMGKYQLRMILRLKLIVVENIIVEIYMSTDSMFLSLQLFICITLPCRAMAFVSFCY